jgi:hypothetical protein
MSVRLPVPGRGGAGQGAGRGAGRGWGIAISVLPSTVGSVTEASLGRACSGSGASARASAFVVQDVVGLDEVACVPGGSPGQGRVSSGGGAQNDLVGQIVEPGLVDHCERVVLRHDGHGGLGVERERPEWLRRERSLRAEVQREEARLRAERSGDGGAR